MSPTSLTTVRELDRRTNDGLDVKLLWDSATDRVYVAVEDHRHGDAFELEVDPADALDAFHHPFAYATTDYDVMSLSIEPAASAQQRSKEEL
jgi:hypothetical protein